MLQNRSYIYDCALAIIAFSGSGNFTLTAAADYSAGFSVSKAKRTVPSALRLQGGAPAAIIRRKSRAAFFVEAGGAWKNRYWKQIWPGLSW